jgi:hypothetical protein
MSKNSFDLIELKPEEVSKIKVFEGISMLCLSGSNRQLMHAWHQLSFLRPKKSKAIEFSSKKKLGKDKPTHT